MLSIQGILHSETSTIHLNSGSTLIGDILSWNGDKGTIKTEFGIVPIEKKNLTKDSLDQINAIPTIGSGFTIMFKSGASLQGTLVAWDGEKGMLKTEVGDISFGKDKVSEESLSILSKVTPSISPPNQTNTSATPNPTPFPTPSDPTEYQKSAKFAVIIQTYDSRGSVLAAGSGFIVKYNNKIYLFTNIHVVSGAGSIIAKGMNGKIMKLGNLLVAADRDLAAFELPEEKDGAEILDRVEKNVMVNNDVAIMGNSLGGRVTTEIRGKILAIGPDLIETDAKFVSGNSGSPAIDTKTGKVIGIATFHDVGQLSDKDPSHNDSKFNKQIRRFCWRVDNAEQWIPMSWSTFSKETSYIEGEDLRTQDLSYVIFTIIKERKVPTNYDFKLPQSELANALHLYLRDYARMCETSISRTNGEQFSYRAKKLLQDISSECDNRNNINFHVNYIYGDTERMKDIKERQESLKKWIDNESQKLAADPNFWCH